MTTGRSQERRGRNVTVIDTYHFYSIAVEAGFYGDTGSVIGFFTKLSYVHLGQYLDG